MKIAWRFGFADGGTLELAARSDGQHIDLTINGLKQRLSLDECRPLLDAMATWQEVTSPFEWVAFDCGVGVVREGDAVFVPARLQVERVGKPVANKFRLSLIVNERRANVELSVADWFDLLSLWGALVTRLNVNAFVSPVEAVVNRALASAANEVKGETTQHVQA